MENLPTEMMLHIFKYLNQSDLLQCLGVCKDWQDIVVSYGLTTLDLVLPHENEETLLENLRRTRLKVSTVNIRQELTGMLSEELLKEVGSTVKKLTIEELPVDTREESLATLLKSFVVVDELHCLLCPRLGQQLPTQLTSITRFILTIQIWIDFSHVERLVAQMPNLRHLGIHSGGITAHNDIIKTIRHQIGSIRSLDLQNCRTNNATLLLEKLTDLSGLHLEELTINISFVAEPVVMALFDCQPKLTKLCLASMTEISNVRDIVNKLPNLRSLSIEITEIVMKVDLYLASLLDIRQLHSVRFEQRSLYESPNLHPFRFHKLPKSNLRQFRLVCFPECTIPNMNEFCKAIKNLSSLSLRSAQISNMALNVVFQHLRQLRNLDLSHTNITDDGLTGRAKKEEKRVKTNSLRNLKGLQTLNIMSCPRITLKAFEEDFELLDLREITLTELPTRIEDINNANFKRLDTIKVSAKSLGENTCRQAKEILPRLRLIKEVYD